MFSKRFDGRRQRVHLGVTQSGIKGLFTGNYLCWTLDSDQFQKLSEDRHKLKDYADMLGFDVEDSNNVSAS